MTEAFALVLHSHLPYARGAGRWPHGEEWVHEAILGTYLPLLGLLHDLRESGVPYQMTIGLTPTLIWLPECAYAPGLEDILETHGLTHFFTDAALLGGKRLVREGHAFERERSGSGLAAPLIAAADDTLRPYLVRESNVVAIARHDQVSGQVWSAMMGYPGEAAYREFHRKDDRSGLRYWRVTDTKTGLGAKEPYSPGAAAERVRAHAVHFVGLVRETLAAHREDRGSDALLTVTFDSEL